MMGRSRSKADRGAPKGADGDAADGSEMMYESDCEQRLVPRFVCKF